MYVCERVCVRVCACIGTLDRQASVNYGGVCIYLCVYVRERESVTCVFL